MPGTCHTTKMGSPTVVLITHFATEIMLIAFPNQGCERPSSGFVTSLQMYASNEFTHFLGILMVEQTLHISEMIKHRAVASNLQRTLVT